ncbi:MAG TPA: DDE-type integrase/transposase/recombinase [Methanomassiliicoccales archaeon]|nr:DDE-type integrase/transposase/recombinase [Methanomassiliicoccales archaeon]
MFDEIPSHTNDEEIDKRKVRDWFKVRKYVVNRIRNGASQANAARWAGVSLGFVNKWWNIWMDNKTWDALRSRSCAPRTVRIKRWQFTDDIVQIKNEHPELGVQKLHAMLNIDLSHQKVYEVLIEEGLITPGPKARRKWRAFSRKHSNSLWQCDVMELKDEGGLYLLTFIDDHSRFVVASRLLSSVTVEAVVETLLRAVRSFGRPRQILTDHGTQFIHNKSGEMTKFGTTCAELGIKHIMAQIRKPTTCGKIERWHRSFREEYLAKHLDDLKSVGSTMPDWLEFYNTVRPHWALDLKTPMEVYLADFIIPEDFA